MAHVAKWKYAEVNKLADLAASEPVIGIAKIDSIPSNNMHQIRRDLRDHATIRVAKNSLLVRALEKASGNGRAGLDELADHCDGMSVLIASDMSPFKLYKKLEAAKSKAPAKAGQIAPADIVIQKGDTPFKPGPIVGDLQQAGIPARIDQGKVVISATKTVVEAGQPVPEALARMLPRLEIMPITVGLELQAAWEDGVLYKRDDLNVDEETILANLVAGARNAQALALEVAYPTPQVMPLLIGKAHREAMAVALEAAFPDKDTIEELIARAYRAASGISDMVPDAPAAAEPEPEPEAEEAEASDEGETEQTDDAGEDSEEEAAEADDDAGSE